MEVVKTITLNLLAPTRVKQEKLLELKDAYTEALSFVVSNRVKVSRIKLQILYYRDIRKLGLHSQIANDLFKDAVAILTTMASFMPRFLMETCQ